LKYQQNLKSTEIYQNCWYFTKFDRNFINISISYYLGCFTTIGFKT